MTLYERIQKTQESLDGARVMVLATRRAIEDSKEMVRKNRELASKSRELLQTG